MLRDLTLSSSPSRCVPCTPHQSRTDPGGTVKDIIIVDMIIRRMIEIVL